MNRDAFAGITISTLVLFLLIGVVSLGMWGCPKYGVWEQELKGQAELARAQSNRMIAVQEAEAKKEAATKLAAAEVERAKGVAAANKIIGDSLKDNEAYLRYLWIHSLEEGKSEVIYVPTEANLPILEANRFNMKPQPEVKK